MFPAHRPLRNVVEGVESLHSHTRGSRTGAATSSASQRESMLHHGVVDQAHIEGVGEGRWGFQGCPSSWSCRSPRLAEAVEGADAGGELMGKKGFWGPGRITVTPVLCVGVSTVA